MIQGGVNLGSTRMSELEHDQPAVQSWVNPYAGRDIEDVQREARVTYPLETVLNFVDVATIDPDSRDMVMANGSVNGNPICTADKGVFVPVYVLTEDGLGKTVYVAEPNILAVTLPTLRFN